MPPGRQGKQMIAVEKLMCDIRTQTDQIQSVPLTAVSVFEEFVPVSCCLANISLGVAVKPLITKPDLA